MNIIHLDIDWQKCPTKKNIMEYLIFEINT